MTRPLRSVVGQRGFTLAELMIALVLGALVVLASTAMVVTSRATYRTQDETTRLAESARAGVELGNRLVRLAGYTNFGEDELPPPAYSPSGVWAASPDPYSLDGPNLVGADASAPNGGTVVNGSDALVIRFYGSGTPTVPNDPAYGNVLDCAGEPVPAPALNFSAYSTSRAYNVLFVGTDPDGEPALKCVRQSYDATTGAPNPTLEPAQTLIRGVEDFQVLYGEAIPMLPPHDDLDTNPPAALVYRTGIGGANPVQHWENVMTVRIAMLLRSGPGALTKPEDTTVTYKLFGDSYAVSADAGTTFSLATLNVPDRTRARRVVETTVFVRNRVASWPSLDQIN